jgi:glycosyltransferase involved in cell wall biosynthesis
MSRREIWFSITHSGTGGAHLVTLNVAAALASRGYPVDVLAIFPSASASTSPSQGADWIHLADRKPAGMLSLLRAFSRLVKLIRERKPVVIFSALPAANLVFPLATLLSGQRDTRCITIHHTEVSTHSRVSRLVDSLLGASRAIERTVCVSHAVSSSLRRRGHRYRRKTLVIHNALDETVARAIEGLADERRRTHKPGRVVIATGRLASQKNYETLLRAFVDVRDATLLIVGKGPDAEALKALSERLGLRERVVFLGFRPHGETLEYLAGADLFVQPSLFEGHSMALLEAAAMGLPIVTSDTQAQREAVTRSDGALCARVIPPTDARALAESINDLLDDRSEAERLAALARSCADEYRHERMIDAYATLIDERPPAVEAVTPGASAPSSLQVRQ